MNTIKKDGSKLLITVDENTYYYDYKDNSYVSEHGNKIKNSTMKSKLRGLRLKDFDNDNTDRNYFELLKFIDSYEWGDMNIGTLLAKLKDYQEEEKFYCLGIYIRYKMYPREFELLKLTPSKIKFLLLIKNKILDSKKWTYTFKDDILLDFVKLIYKETKDIDIVSQMFDTIYSKENSLKSLLTTHKYDKKSLINYLFRISNSEGLHTTDIIEDLNDYAYMSNIIQNGKYNKYPRFLLSIHAIVSKNYKTYIEKHDEELFGKIMTQYNKYKYKYRKYAIGIPTTTQNILNEGTELRHCVASYIKNILNGQTAILFMRDVEKINEPLITIEFKNGAIIQAKGLLNRKPNEEEEKFIRRFAEKFKIEVKSF